MGFFDRIFHRSPKVRTLTAGMTPLKIPSWVRAGDSVGAVYAYAKPIAERIASVPLSCTADPAPAVARALDRETVYRIAIGVLTSSVILLVPRTDGGESPTTSNVRAFDVMTGEGVDLSSEVIQTDVGSFSPDDVCMLSYDVLPDGTPVSPMQLAGDWVDIDQMTAAHERAFFANGAVPAAMVNIVSETNEDFEREKTRYEDSVRGAGQSNGTIYTRTPVDPMTGEPVRPKIDVQTIQPPNNELDLATIDDITDRHLAEIYGTPGVVRGIDIGQTYSNAELAEVSFTRYTVAPFAARLAAQLSRELRRITRDGRAWELSFELPDMELTDRAAVRANVNATTVSSLLALKGAGFGTREAINALGLSERWLALVGGDGAGGDGVGGDAPVAVEPPSAPDGEDAPSASAVRVSASDAGGHSTAERRVHKILEKMRAEVSESGRESLAEELADYLYGVMQDEGTAPTDELKRVIEDTFGTALAAAALLAALTHGRRTLVEWCTQLAARCDVDAEVQWRRAESILDEAPERYIRARDAEALAYASRETGAEILKTWETCRDDLVCETCRALDGVTIPADGDFPSVGACPPAHPHCRCAIRYSWANGGEYTSGGGER